MKKWILIGVLVLIMSQVALWTNQGGLFDFFKLQTALKSQMKENQTLIERNAALTGDVVDLKEGLEAVEERARNEMGLIKEGETFYQVVNHDET